MTDINPASVPTAPAAEASEAPVAVPTPSAPPITKFILVVEDDPVLKNLLGHTFAGKYQTLYAANGNEALTLFDQYKPALVLLDLMLPIMDGFTVLEKLRARTDEGKTVPVIVVSNLGQESDKERVMQLGANAYLVKAEVDIDEIVAKIGEFLVA